MTLIQEIKQCIEQQLEKKKKFIIFPFGDIGMQVNNILKDSYNINAEYILDNHLSKYNPNIKPLTFLNQINCQNYILILACTDSKIYINLKETIIKYFSEDNVAELISMKTFFKKEDYTIVGKYSYGPLCNHWLVESVGAFCSFAEGSDVVPNHPMEYLSTHPFLYLNNNIHNFLQPYNKEKNAPWYFEGIPSNHKQISINKLKRIKIGNDVWLGKNVIITNGANIGNGVIAGASAIITKDIPDYAVVVGSPARIIRYRYTLEQIEDLNKIQWWNWSDEQIRERYEDFYLPISIFIEKYKKTP